MTDYDNNNRGACWPIDKATTVTAEIGGRKFNGAMVLTKATAPNAPALNLFLRCQDKRSEVYCVALFKSDKGTKKLAGGDFSMITGESFWVALFPNENENPNSPKFDLSFQPKEAAPQSAGPSEAPEDPGDDWF